MVANVFHAYQQFGGDLIPRMFATAWPALGTFTSLFGRAILYSSAAALGINIFLSRWREKRWWVWIVGVLFLVSLGSDSPHSLADYMAGWVGSFIPLATAIAVVALFFRDNTLAYIVVPLGVQTAKELLDLFSQHDKFYFQNGIALALMVGIVLVWLLWPGGKQKEI
jgi:hypothetical protein